MIFYDFEVTKYDWLVVLTDTTLEKTCCIVNNKDELIKYYKEHEHDIFIGFNNKNYDQYIFKGIMLGLNPYEISQKIIKDKVQGWAISNQFKDITLYGYDVMMNTGFKGLKRLEGFIGDDITETSVDFDIDRKLTREELRSMIKYCMKDVEKTIKIFRLTLPEFTAHFDLMEMSGGDVRDMLKTKVQLSAKILGATKKKHDDDEFDLIIPDNAKIEKYTEVLDFFYTAKSYEREVTGKSGKTLIRKNELDIDIADVPHKLGFGGIHGARKNYHKRGKFLLADVTSLYPTIMIKYGYLSRNVENPQIFTDLYNKNVELKLQNRKDLRAPYKITCNGTYGAMKDKYNPLYDPRNANNVCITGQILLVDLIERLEKCCTLIQSNTDGILVEYSNIDEVKRICKEWESRTGLELEYDLVTEVHQKDVNNYIIKYLNGGYHAKGLFLKDTDTLDNNLSIVNEALREYFLNKTPIEDTINNCTDIIKFQNIVSASSSAVDYTGFMCGDELVKLKYARVFAVKNGHDIRLATKDKTIKIPNVSCNSIMSNKGIPNDIDLDKNFYIEIAKNRLQKFY